MDNLAEHRQMLEAAAAGKLPDRIHGRSGYSVAVFRELYEDGLMRAIDAGSQDGDEYLEPRITLTGRAYLNDLQARAAAASLAGKAMRAASSLWKWIAGILANLISRLF